MSGKAFDTQGLANWDGKVGKGFGKAWEERRMGLLDQNAARNNRAEARRGRQNGRLAGRARERRIFWRIYSTPEQYQKSGVCQEIVLGYCIRALLRARSEAWTACFVTHSTLRKLVIYYRKMALFERPGIANLSQMKLIQRLCSLGRFGPRHGLSCRDSGGQAYAGLRYWKRPGPATGAGGDYADTHAG